jgi:hypothetical protein
MNLCDAGLMHIKEWHAVPLGAFQPPGVIIDGLPFTVSVFIGLNPGNGNVTIGARQVIAGAEGPACPPDNYTVYIAVVIRLPQGFTELLLQSQCKSIQFLRPVKGYAGSSFLHFVDNVFKFTHLSHLLSSD